MKSSSLMKVIVILTSVRVCKHETRANIALPYSSYPLEWRNKCKSSQGQTHRPQQPKSEAAPSTNPWRDNDKWASLSRPAHAYFYGMLSSIVLFYDLKGKLDAKEKLREFTSTFIKHNGLLFLLLLLNCYDFEHLHKL